MKRFEIKVAGFEMSIPVPDDIETNKEAQKAFIEENKSQIMLFAAMGSLFGKPSIKIRDCGNENDKQETKVATNAV